MEKTQGGPNTLQAVIDALRKLRPPFALYEKDIHSQVAACLEGAGLDCRHEAAIAKGCRIDFLVDSVGVEVKKGKPAPAQLLPQLRRYAASERISALVLVSQRQVRLPAQLNGKPLRIIVLSQLWGVALP